MRNFDSVLMLSTETCGPCRRLKPILIEHCEHHGIPLEIRHIEGPTDPMVVTYDVRGVPTVLLLKDGEVVDRRVGGMTPAQAADFLQLQ